MRERGSLKRQIIIGQECLSLIRSEADTAGLIETGGNLAGYVSNEFIRVVAASSPGPRAVRESSSLFLSGLDTAEWLDSLRKIDPSLRYLGDWHTHFFSVNPSTMDLVAITAMAAYEPFDWPNPLSFIFRPRRFRLSEILAVYRLNGDHLRRSKWQSG